MYECGVVHAVRARGGPDPGDPQSPELALAVATIAVRVGAGVQELFLGHPEPRTPGPPIALGGVEDLAALLAGVDGSLDPGHCPYFPRSRRSVPASALISPIPSMRRRRPPLFLR